MLFAGDDGALVAALRKGHPGAATALFDRHVAHVQRVVIRIMGADDEIPDLVNEVFYQALRSIHSLRDPDRLGGWMTRIAVFTARKCIRSRKRRSWLRIVGDDQIPEPAWSAPVESSDESVELYGQVRRIMDRMPVDERIVFSLRYMDGMEIADLADACGLSLRTAKRRLARCETRFKALAATEPLVRMRLDAGGKWRNR